jgi:hypothetical protein
MSDLLGRGVSTPVLFLISGQHEKAWARNSPYDDVELPKSAFCRKPPSDESNKRPTISTGCPSLAVPRSMRPFSSHSPSAPGVPEGEVGARSGSQPRARHSESPFEEGEPRLFEGPISYESEVTGEGANTDDQAKLPLLAPRRSTISGRTLMAPH